MVNDKALRQHLAKKQTKQKQKLCQTDSGLLSMQVSMRVIAGSASGA